MCCCFELLLFSVILCYALWHDNRYSAGGVMEFICCNQTLGLFFIIIIHRVQEPRLALHFSEASRRPFVVELLTPVYPICSKGPSNSLGQGDYFYLGMACMNHEALQKTKHTDNTCCRIFAGHFRFRKKKKNPQALINYC